MRIVGLVPGLRATGWGVIFAEGNRLSHVAHGTIRSNPDEDLAYRLRSLHDALTEILNEWQPQSAAVEATFVNKNPASTLKLGQARGVVLLAPAQAGLPVAEYAPPVIKKAVVGTGAADKDQVLATTGKAPVRNTLHIAAQETH